MTPHPQTRSGRTALRPTLLPLANLLRDRFLKCAWPGQFLVVLLSLVLLAPVIPIPHVGRLFGLRVFLIQAAVFGGLFLLFLTQRRALTENIKSLVTRGPGLPILLLLVWSLGSFLLTSSQNTSERPIPQVELLRLGTGASLYFAAVCGFRSRFQLRTAGLFLRGGALVAAAAAFFTGSLFVIRPARGAFGEEQLMGAFLAVLLPVIAVFALKDLFAHQNLTASRGLTANRLLKAAGTILVLGALLLTGERMSWISGTAGLLLALRLAFWARLIQIPVFTDRAAKTRFWSAPVLTGAVILGVNLLFMCCVPALHHRLEIGQEKASLHDRLQLWTACEDMIRQRPLTGWGVGTFPLIAHRYIATIPSAAQVEMQGVTLSSIAHSEYLQMGAELGLVGIGLYLAAILGFFFYGIHALKGLTSPGRRWLLLASLVGVASQVINAVSNPGWHYSDISPLLWLLMGLGMAAATPQARRKTDAVPFAVRPVSLWHQSRSLGRAVVCCAVGVGLILTSMHNSLGDSRARALAGAGYGPPVVGAVSASPNPLPAEGGDLTGGATVTVDQYIPADISAVVSRDDGTFFEIDYGRYYNYSGPHTYDFTYDFTIPPNFGASDATWTVTFYAAYNPFFPPYEVYPVTSSTSVTQPPLPPKITEVDTKTSANGLDSFTSADTITLKAMTAPNTDVLWTVTGLQAAAGISGFPTNWKTRADNSGVSTFSFRADDNGEFVDNRNTNWTQGRLYPNTPIQFGVSATFVLNGSTVTDSLDQHPELGQLKQNETDTLRQEFVDFGYSVPEISDVVPTIETWDPNPANKYGFNTGNYSHVQLSNHLLDKRNAIMTAYHGSKVIDVRGNVLKDAQGNPVTVPDSATITVTSGFRNPQRNAFFSIHIDPNDLSHHVLGSALDLKPSAFPVRLPARTVLDINRYIYPTLLRAAKVAATDPNHQPIPEKGNTERIPLGSPLEDHIHVQW